MIIYAGIDGTGTDDNEEYARTFADSFVNRLQKTFPDKPFYTRGPALDGMTTLALAGTAFAHVASYWRNESEDAVVLAGYSRGGAGVIETAQMLKKQGIPVECLILFDAVDRSTVVGSPVSGYLPPEYRHYIKDYDFCIGTNTLIADTVKQVIYAQRLRMQTRSRWSFQNCGFLRENPEMPFIHAQFYATHGGLGGTPWTEIENPYPEIPQSVMDAVWSGNTIWEAGEIAPTTLSPLTDSAGAASVWGWAYPQIMRVKTEWEFRDGSPAGPGSPTLPSNPNQPNPPADPRLEPGQRLHIVRPGDWLSKIAVTYYGDYTKYKAIHEWSDKTNGNWNRREIGPNPDLIKPGMRIIIPPKEAIG